MREVVGGEVEWLVRACVDRPGGEVRYGAEGGTAAHGEWVLKGIEGALLSEWKLVVVQKGVVR